MLSATVYALAILVMTAHGPVTVTMPEPFDTAGQCAEAAIRAGEIETAKAVLVAWKCYPVARTVSS